MKSRRWLQHDRILRPFFHRLRREKVAVGYDETPSIRIHPKHDMLQPHAVISCREILTVLPPWLSSRSRLALMTAWDIKRPPFTALRATDPFSEMSPSSRDSNLNAPDIPSYNDSAFRIGPAWSHIRFWTS